MSVINVKEGVQVPTCMSLTSTELILRSTSSVPCTFRVVNFALNVFGLELYQNYDSQVDLKSCIDSVIVINQIFLDKKEFNFFHKLIEINWKISCKKKEEVLHLVDLPFALPISQIFKPHIDSSRFSLAKREIYDKATQLLQSIKGFKQLTTHDYNKSVLENLREDLKNYFKPKTSYIYNIFLKYTSPYANLPDNTISVLHAFCIEQINDYQEPYFRLINSWVDEWTLLEDFKARNYSESNILNGCWDSKKMEDFLINLEKVAVESSNAFIDTKALSDCFKCKFTDLRLRRFVEEDQGEKTLKGLSIFYSLHEISYLKSVNNLAAIVDQSSRIKKRLENHPYC